MKACLNLAVSVELTAFLAYSWSSVKATDPSSGGGGTNAKLLGISSFDKKPCNKPGFISFTASTFVGPREDLVDLHAGRSRDIVSALIIPYIFNCLFIIFII